MLLLGFSLPNCAPVCRCGPITGEYFDVKGMDVTHARKDPNRQVEADELMDFEDYTGINIAFDVEYVASLSRQANPWRFSLIPEALACDCEYNGISGSKSERLDSFQVITLNDFDDEHPANSSINDLLTAYDIWGGDVDPLNEIVANYQGNLQEEAMTLKLAKAPELDKEFRVKVVVGLSTGEVYEQEVYPVRFK